MRYLVEYKKFDFTGWACRSGGYISDPDEAIKFKSEKEARDFIDSEKIDEYATLTIKPYN